MNWIFNPERRPCFPKHVPISNSLIIHLFIMHLLSTYYVPHTVKCAWYQLINDSFLTLKYLIVHRRTKQHIRYITTHCHRNRVIHKYYESTEEIWLIPTQRVWKDFIAMTKLHLGFQGYVEVGQAMNEWMNSLTG